MVSPRAVGKRQQIFGRGTPEFDGFLTKNTTEAKTDHGVSFVSINRSFADKNNHSTSNAKPVATIGSGSRRAVIIVGGRRGNLPGTGASPNADMT
ncbi:hypothetical protein DSCA_42180 [Desulfosarcina alkanivorans]|uniref:Uncharacterized protein n=1 Tax=Desulfosarcina alkanivorans TaxID=571177 RepID=A0A5K7YNA1_9BACT|nr:hypothetical protein DSCA_42180 [Desulfosarcina alkanivorans]